MNDYQLDIAEIFRRFHISELGLSEGEARMRLGQYGPNRLAEEEAISRLKIFPISSPGRSSISSCWRPS
ncbi:MAG: cation-transporting P-type ATPase [Deltaproteobacteria bacterium]|jgi:magnesium-transporting ATPase (P-type)|nr:cation-transporting P-type ATPase [Deltaproteobacteria bacterium]